MNNGKKYISIIALILCISCFLSACGGPAGKIQKSTHAKYYYEDVEGEQPDDIQSDITKNNSSGYPSKAELEKLKKSLPEEMPLLAADGESFAYDIVYPADAQRTVTLAVKTLRSSVQS
ncbi:MAG: hypothetical protein J5662_07400, partial [Clostridia bacterium]|nr:hypothetical protein [Clostridia bacterium]